MGNKTRFSFSKIIAIIKERAIGEKQAYHSREICYKIMSAIHRSSCSLNGKEAMDWSVNIGLEVTELQYKSNAKGREKEWGWTMRRCGRHLKRLKLAEESKSYCYSLNTKNQGQPEDLGENDKLEM